MNNLQEINKWFWNEDVWLPPNETWADRVSTIENQLPNYTDLWTYPFLIALLLIIVRYIFLIPHIINPLAKQFGIEDAPPKSVTPSPVLEQYYRVYSSKVPPEVVKSCAKKLDWSEIKVESWFKERQSMNSMTMFTRFEENLWQLLYYICAFSFGSYVLSDKIWLYDIRYCWIGYPKFKLHTDVWWYYMSALGFYWSVTFTHFFETRRKDFYLILIHHLLTISLLVFSFTCNYTRVGLLTAVLHDIADIPLYMNKLCMCLGWNRAKDHVFTAFAASWIATRCIYFPLKIVSSVLFYTHTVIEMHPVYYIFSSLLVALSIFNYYWGYLIIRILLKTYTKNYKPTNVKGCSSFSGGSCVREEVQNVSKKK